METKLIEVRDAGTFIPVLCVRPSPSSGPEEYLWARSGYGHNPETYVLVGEINGGSGLLLSDPYGWRSRTLRLAHTYIEARWDELVTGDVVDVEFIQGGTPAPKVSERLEVRRG